MTFKKWILSFANDNNRVGDFAKDIKADNNFPNTDNKDLILEYFEDQNASDFVFDAFEEAWQEYLKQN